MPKFLSRQECYRMLQRELPEGVYPDGPPSKFYSTADMDSIADVMATGYANLERIYANFWPETAEEKLTDWEITAFGSPLDANLSLAERRQRVITKLRSKKGITKNDIEEAVKSIIGTDKNVQIVQWGCPGGVYGTWEIGLSLLGYNTYLGGGNILRITGIDACEVDPADYGMSEEEWDAVKKQAYTYEVRIAEYTLSPTERLALDSALSEAEPARSAHVIYDGVPAPSAIYFGFEDDPDALGFGDLENPNTGGIFKGLDD